MSLDEKTSARLEGLGRRHPRNLVLGSAQWGMSYGVSNRMGRPPVEEVAAMLRVAKRASVATIDTARAYGTSEGVIGALLANDDHFELVTKLAPNLSGQQLALDEARVRLEASLAQSHAQLGRERLDVLLLHRAHHRSAYDGALWDALLERRERGEIGALGVSAANPVEAQALVEDPTVEVLQVAASLLDQRLARRGFFERAQLLGKRVFVRSVYLQGAAHLPPERLPDHLAELAKPLEHIGAWAGERGIRAAQACLLYARDCLDAPILLGCECTAQLCANLVAWRSLDADPAELTDLAAAIPDLSEPALDPSRWPRP